MSTQLITDGKVVDLKYRLKSSSGEVLDEADAGDPFTYLHGAAQIVPGLESALTGLKIGDKKSVTVAAAQGYGEVDPELKLSVKKSQFPQGAQIQPGMQFEANSPDGGAMVFTVEKLEGEMVHIDGNHPLAGQDLHFEVEVLSMRDATAEEKAHGHAHGPDGHHHH